MKEPSQGFEGFFEEVTGESPYRYQRELANIEIEDCLIRIPTGCGKTAAVIVGWLWRIAHKIPGTPRRLVYCLPMRVLVEQTRDLAEDWAEKSETGARVHTLMGGESDEGWEIEPDRPTILVGTQDMLLSRALNRGYAMNRYRWPVHFGLLNADSVWVCDEIQLMGNGLGTTTQLQAFRESWKAPGPTATWWMSATADRAWLKTVDYAARTESLKVVDLDQTDRTGALASVYGAAKPVTRMEKLDRDAVVSAHHPGSLTLVVVNTVMRARTLHESLRATGTKSGQRSKKPAKPAGALETLLIHSRFRPPDRARAIELLLAADRTLRGKPAKFADEDAAWIERVREAGLIVVSTQVVEAGVDISAETLITELAPWPNIVQRLGRCNRRGAQDARARVYWIPVPAKHSAPYEPQHLAEAASVLETLEDGSVAALEKAGTLPPLEFSHVIRRHDVHGLFATERDLAGGFTDVSPYVRDTEHDTSVYVFWRERPSPEEPSPGRNEICPVAISDLIEYLKDAKPPAREWNGETGQWEWRRPGDVRPGMTLLLDQHCGGYRDEVGWTGSADDFPTVHTSPEPSTDAMDGDGWSGTNWGLLADHLRDAEAEARQLVSNLGLGGTREAEALILASRWHDLGKNQPKWRDAIPKAGQPGDGPWAKFPRGTNFRPGIRHEAASALYSWDRWRQQSAGWSALAVYLVAAHHGKVRTVLRSRKGGSGDVFGIIGGDTLPALHGWTDAEYALDTACRLFGASGDWLDNDASFVQLAPSWVAMIAELLGPESPKDIAPCEAIQADEPRHLGPFELAYLEALAVAVDIRASRKPGAGEKK